MNYAVLEIPDFPLAARARLEPTQERPAAIFTGSGRRSVIGHLNQAALDRGLRLGMSGIQALGECPGILLWQRHETAEAEATALLLTEAWRLSPRAEVTGPGLCTVALDGRDLAGLKIDTARVRLELAEQGLPTRIGVGTTSGVARFAAHQADAGAPECWVGDSLAFLRPLPIHLLELTESEATLFTSLGLRTLGDIARLPQQSLAQRLGERGAKLWTLATGQDRRALNTATPPTRFLTRYDLEFPAETLEPLLFLLRRFVDRLAAELRHGSFVADRIRLALLLEDETRHEREFRLPQPTARDDSIFAVLEQYLSTLKTDSSVVGLELELYPGEAATRQEGLFESSLRDPHQFYDTLARLAAVVGADRVGTPQCRDSLRPDAVILIPPPAAIAEYRPVPRPPLVGPMLRRLRPAQAATVELRDLRPTYLLCPAASIQGAIRDTRGPWPRSGNWWDRDTWAQDEWDVQLDAGGLYRLSQTRDGWWVEGVYD
jgi:protein ImuB